jgi:hypothetical protein
VRPFQALRMRSTAVAGGVPSIVRAARASYVNNAASIVFTLPTGSLAGDLCVIDCSHYWVTTCPSGWVPLIDLQGSNYEAMTFFKVLTSGDIATGSVTINFSNAGYGTVVGATFIGNYGIRNFVAAVNAANASTRSLTTDSTPATGDNMLLFASVRGNPVISSSDLSSDVVSDYQANSSALLRQGTASGAGAMTVTTAYSSTGWSGDHQALIGLSPVNGSTDYANTGGTGNRSSLITVTATSIAAGGGSPGDTVDGSLANSYWFNGGTGNGTQRLTFDFGSGASKIIDQFRLFQDVVASHGVWRWEGSNDNLTSTQCGLDFTLLGGPTPLPIIVPNTTGYRYYWLRHMSGTRSTTPYIREFQFRIG